MPVRPYSEPCTGAGRFRVGDGIDRIIWSKWYAAHGLIPADHQLMRIRQAERRCPYCGIDHLITAHGR